MKPNKRKDSESTQDFNADRNVMTIRRLQAMVSPQITMTVGCTIEGGHVRVNIKEIKAHDQRKKVLQVTDNEEKTVTLETGTTYLFEWFVTSSAETSMRIQASIQPANGGFETLDLSKKYPAGANDGNAFLFTLNR